MTTRPRKRWPRGTWMRLKSADLLQALMRPDRTQDPVRYDIPLAKLARYSGCSKGFISHLMAGRRSSCTPELAERIAEALNVPLEVLFEPNVSTDSTSKNNSK